MLSSDAEVIRDGKNVSIPAVEVVPGDVVVVNLGDRIPADIRMIEVSNLACSEGKTFASTSLLLLMQAITNPLVV